MKTKLYFFALLITTATAAQISNLGDEPLDVTLYQIGVANGGYESAKSSPYLNERFLPVKINTFEKTQLIRLNVVDNTIEITLKDGKIGLLNLSIDYQLNFVDESSKMYETKTFIDDLGKEARSFFEALKATDNYSLYVKERKTFMPAKKASSYSDASPAQFLKVHNTFYIMDFKSKSSTLFELPLKKKKFLAFLG